MGFIHFNESMEILNNINISNFKRVKKYLLDCLGYVLAEDIIASYNSPEFATSAMDGLALGF